MKDPVRNFVDAWERWDEARGHDGSVDIDWERRFRDAGYYSATLNPSVSAWNPVHHWCWQNFGDGHYAWTGTTFWFENERDATLFALRWS